MHFGIKGFIAQLAEQFPLKEQVGGSLPSEFTKQI